MLAVLGLLSVVYVVLLFPLYRLASYSVRPVLLDLFERYYVPLGPRAVPCLPGLVLALLSAMEDVGSEFFHRAVGLLDALAECTPTAARPDPAPRQQAQAGLQRCVGYERAPPTAV